MHACKHNTVALRQKSICIHGPAEQAHRSLRLPMDLQASSLPDFLSVARRVVPN